MKLPRFMQACAAAAFLCTGMAATAAMGDLPAVQRHGEVSYLTGGVGVNQATAFKQEADRYPLAIQIARRAGGQNQYTAGAEVAISDSSGRAMLQTQAQGPFLLADLPPGRYQVEVSLDGKTQRRDVTVKDSGTARPMFVFGRDR